jgi:sulfur-carrier protein
VIVTVKPFLFLRDILGFTSREIFLPEGARIKELLTILRSEHKLPDQVVLPQGSLVLFEGDRPVGFSLLINGRNVRQVEGLDTVLNNGDTVTLFPPAAGG